MEYIHDKRFTQIGRDEIMYTDFEGCEFAGCDLSRCDYTGTAFIDCRFIDCNFAGAKINYVAFRDVSFFNCDFSDVNFAMVDKLLFIISMTGCNLDRAKFYTLKLPKTVFTDCSFVATDFMAADLTDVIFDNCDLHKAVFIDTIANKTDFLSSRNFTIDPERNRLKRAIFSESGLRGLLAKYDLVIK
ncbi:pentapeptide repeat-containing protein [Flavobacterium silvaticum]|uniref:Pentapeptide repeat-containing protein n=1 Tax=Flavobacterium silvaticum TaxID=1852020 RepID=A0A972JH60_9FLAO|nr:pentapeptide repeat-containing protein [Flavobacterium silvaticum]NMH28901.1 pentapeptide repeat-containing protein [Flavobacterium silvaticum]